MNKDPSSLDKRIQDLRSFPLDVEKYLEFISANPASHSGSPNINQNAYNNPMYQDELYYNQDHQNKKKLG